MRDSIAALRGFPASLPWALAEPSVTASESFCRQAHADFIARRDLPLLLFRREDGVLVGSSGLHRMDWSVAKFEVGFWGRSTQRSRGYVTEGVAAIVAFAFEHLDAQRVEAFPDDANERSCNVCERVGMLLEGTLRNERVEPDGTLRHTRVYAKTRSPSVNQG